MNKDFFEHIPLGTSLFGRFQLLEVIAAGETSGIYKVLSTWGSTRGTELALKITNVESSHTGKGSVDTESQLIKEIRLLSKIKSPNIVQAYDWFKDDLFLAYSMEYMERGSIEPLLRNSCNQSIQSALDILVPVALGLYDIHQAGIIHRDIKPQNILVNGAGQIKIADFGIAERNQPFLTKLNDPITGTIDFVSPEYVRDGSYDQRSDIYAWGTLCFLALTGHVPFEDESIVDALAKKASLNPPSVRQYRQDIPDYLFDICMKSIALNPADRFQSMSELLYVLNQGQSLVSHKTTGIKALEFLGFKVANVAI